MTRANPSRPATIADVAALAGVSPATVSRVMNGTRTVDEEMTARVRAAARELSYSASPLARSLVLGRTHTVAVVVPDLGNPTFHGVLRGISHAAARNGYHALVADSAESVVEEKLLARQTRRRCDGLILVAPRMAERDLDDLLGQLRPMVVVNRVPAREVGVPVVTTDYEVGLTGLLDILYAEGHRSLMYLAGPPHSASNAARLVALEQFEAGHPDVTIRHHPCGVNFAEGHDGAPAVIAAGVTGVVAFNDLVAMGLISGLTECGLAVPEDVSVVGFDDIPFARYVSPPLTTASVPVTRLGEQAWRRMWELLGGGDSPESGSDDGLGGTVVLTPHVERRGSTAPVSDRTETATTARMTARRTTDGH